MINLTKAQIQAIKEAARHPDGIFMTIWFRRPALEAIQAAGMIQRTHRVQDPARRLEREAAKAALILEAQGLMGTPDPAWGQALEVLMKAERVHSELAEWVYRLTPAAYELVGLEAPAGPAQKGGQG